MWFKRKPKSETISSTESSAAGKGCLVLFFSVFLLMGLAFLFFFVLQPLWMIARATQWVETPCEVVSSEVKEHADGDGSTYRIVITYKYDVQGKPYTSDRYHFMTGSSSGRDGKQAVVSRHPPGHKTVCYVDPRDPTQAVLARGLQWELLFGLIPLIFVVVGGGGILFALGVFGGKMHAAQSWLPTAKHAPLVSEYAATNAVPGPVRLTGSWSPLGKMLGAIAICAFWNGIVSIFVYHVYEGIRDGDPEWFLVLFLIPFVLVGLGLFGAVIYTFMALFNPRVTLVLDQPQLALGRSLTVEWSFSGRPHLIQRLQIQLRGEESATYRRGTDTYTDTEKFAEFTLIDTTNPLEIPAGKGQISLPEDTMHSFEASHNKVLWTLSVHGDIRRWPDVSETFPLVVLPLELEAAPQATARRS